MMIDTGLSQASRLIELQIEGLEEMFHREIEATSLRVQEGFDAVVANVEDVTTALRSRIEALAGAAAEPPRYTSGIYVNPIYGHERCSSTLAGGGQVNVVANVL